MIPVDIPKRKGMCEFIKNHFENEPIVTGKPSRNILKNKYFRAVVYIVACICTTLFYYGWQDFQTILYRDKVFEWLCTSEEIAGRESLDSKACDKQYSRTQNLFTIATATEFSCAFIAGILTDRYGPLLTSVIGNLILISSWALLLMSNESFPLFWLSTLLMGASVNLIAFPCLELEELFPSRRRLALSVIVAAQTGGSMISVIMRLILDAQPTWTFTGLGIGYLLVVVLPIFILSVCVHPVHRLVIMKKNRQKHITHHESPEINESDPLQTNTDPDDITQNDIRNCDVETQSNTQNRPKDASWMTYVKDTAFRVFQLNYLLFLLYFIINIVAHGYYPTIVKDMFMPTVSDFQGYFYPTQIIWGVLLGYIVDYTGTLVMCGFLCAGYIAAAILAIVGSTVSPPGSYQYASSVIFIMINSYIYSVKYTFLSENYQGPYFQTLVGIVGCLAGLLSLVNLSLEEYSVLIYGSNILIIFSVLVGATGIFLFILYYRLKIKPNKSFN